MLLITNIIYICFYFSIFYAVEQFLNWNLYLHHFCHDVFLKNLIKVNIILRLADFILKSQFYEKRAGIFANNLSEIAFTNNKTAEFCLSQNMPWPNTFNRYAKGAYTNLKICFVKRFSFVC